MQKFLCSAECNVMGETKYLRYWKYHLLFDDGEIFADIVQMQYRTIANRKILIVTVQNYEMQKVHRKRMKWNKSKGFDQKNIMEYCNFCKFS